MIALDDIPLLEETPSLNTDLTQSRTAGRWWTAWLRLPWLPVLVTPFVLLAPVYLAGKALFWGTPLLQFVPWWQLASESLRSGSLPLWNPFSGMGAPLAANYQSALFYPPTWTYFLLSALGGLPLLAWGQALVVALHLAWAAAGMALLVRRLGLGSLAQAIGGLAFGLCGYLVSRAIFPSINAAVAWTPWTLLAVTNLAGSSPLTSSNRELASDAREGKSLGRPGLLGFLFLSLCLTLQLLAGHAQTTWYSLLLAGMWAGLVGWSGACHPGQDGSPRDARWLAGAKGAARLWLWLGLALALAAALSAVQLLPTAEYLRLSQRSSAVDYNLTMLYSFWPWHILTLIAPTLFGSPAQGDYWGYATYWEDALYIGLLPFLLALSVLFGELIRWLRSLRGASRKKSNVLQAGTAFNDLLGGRLSRSMLVLFLFGLILLSFALALGKNTPLFPWLYGRVPTFSMFQAPARYLLWAEFALALLAGLGAETWRRPEARALYWTRLGTAGAFAVMLGAGLAWILMGDISPTFIRATALAGLWGVAAGILSILAPPRPSAAGSPQDMPEAGQVSARSRLSNKDIKPVKVQLNPRVWQWAVVLCVAANLLVEGWGLNPGVDLDLYRGASPTAVKVRSEVGSGRVYLPAYDEQVIKFQRFLQFKTFDPGKDWRGLRAALLPDANLLDGIPSANNFDPLVPGRYAAWMQALAQADTATRARLLNIMGVTLLEKVSAAQEYHVRFKPLAGGERARFVTCALPAANAGEAWAQVVQGQEDLQTHVVLEGVEAPPASSCRPEQAVLLQVVDEGPASVRVSLQAPANGWVVLADTWYPGWRASVDGQPAPVLRANFLFRAVEVPAGIHQVVFTYKPMSFWLGAGISLLSIALLAALLAWLGLRARQASKKVGRKQNS